MARSTKNQNEPVPSSPIEVPLGVLPRLPPRRFQSQAKSNVSETQADETQPSGYGIDAVKLNPKAQKKPQYVVQVPISQETVKRTWQRLRRPMPDSGVQELDLVATIEQIGREGVFSGVVSRPVLQKKSDLLLLIDDSQAMLPFAPVIQPLIQMVLDRRISPAQIYRFSQCPTESLYDWQRPLRSVPLAKVLGRLNRSRTVVIIVSEAGAASPLYPERAERTGAFLVRLLPCVREVIWFNPLSQERWKGTTAEVIQFALSGRMVPFEAGRWEELARSQEVRAGVQRWSFVKK